jgi:peptide/nickel transport system substrate-binding protein
MAGNVRTQAPDENYWTALQRRALTRRRLLTAGAAGSAVAGLALAGCSGQSKSGGAASQSTATAASAGTPKSGGNLVVYLTSNYPLDPQKVSAAAQVVPGTAMSRIFQFKTDTNAATITDHITQPDLGMSAESPDAITWTVKLRPDAKFHNVAPVNGHAVEAEDIKATFQRALDPATASPNRGQLNMLDASQITTPDKQTVVFKLNYQYAPFRSLLASPAYSWIFPREVLSGSYDPSKTVIGSGPWIPDSLQPDVAYTFKRNPNWHGSPLPYADTLKMAVLTDSSQWIAQFTSGAIDEMDIQNLFDVPTVRQQNPKATIVKVALGSAYPLYFQMGDPTAPVYDIRVRQALSMAVDRDAIAKTIYNGEGEQTVYVPGYMGRWSLHVDKLDANTQQYLKYNPTEAKKLLAAAGQSNLQVRLVNPFYSLGNPSIAKQVELINSSFNSVGVKSQIVNGDYNKDFVDAGHGWRQGYFDKDMVIFGSTSSYTEADDWLYSYFHSKSTSNQEHLNDPKYDAMVDKERTLVNDDERVKAVYEIQQYLAQQMYAPSTIGNPAYRAVQARVQNYSFSDSLGKSTEMYAKIWLKS